MVLVDLFVFIVQQLGIVLGTGAEVVLLYCYIRALHHGAVGADHSVLVRGSRHVQAASLGLIIVSGVLAVGSDFYSGSAATIGEPAYIGKWLLIFVVVACFFGQEKVPARYAPWLRGFAGANWLALFLLHSIAPLISWMLLGLLYAFLLLVAMLLWHTALLQVRPKPIPQATAATAAPPAVVAPSAPTVKPVVPPPPPPQKPPPPLSPAPLPAVSHVPLKAVAPTPPPAAPAPKPAPVAPAPPVPVSAPSYDENPDLPAVRVMPKTPGDIAKQFRGSTVEL